VHADLGSDLEWSGNLVAGHIHHYQLFGFQHALAHAAGSSQQVFVIETNGDIAVVGCNPALFEHEPADADDLLAVLLFASRHRINSRP
jgi:hypothetical protein